MDHSEADKEITDAIKSFDGSFYEITILEPSDDLLRRRMYGMQGSNFIVLEQEHIEALQGGKLVAWSDGEYGTIIGLRPIV